MMDIIARIFLAFTHEIMIIPVVIIGYIWDNRKLYYNAILLVLISMIVNYALKVSFQVPLSPNVGKAGFAFPSGHMQTAIVFYGWLYRSYQHIIARAIISTLLIFVALSLMHFGYHNLFDIAGGVFFGLALIYAHQYMQTHLGENRLHIYYIIFCSMILTFIASVDIIYPHLWMAYLALIGLSISEQIWGSGKELVSKKQKIIATSFCFFSVLIIYTIFSPLFLPQSILLIKWLLIGGVIPYSRKFAISL